MGFPYKPNTENPIKQNIHVDGVNGGNMEGETLKTKVLQDSNIKSNTFEENQEMHEGKLF